MSKYIDADKLKAKVKELNLATKTYEEQVAFNNALAMVVEIIDSLQQEQPEGLHFTPLNRLIQKIPSKSWNDTVNNYAKKLRDCLIKEGYRKDAEVLQGYISYMNGNNVPMATMDEHEQPEVELEKEIDKFLNETGAPYVWCNDDEQKEWCNIIARDFWNKGYNARKKEEK